MDPVSLQASGLGFVRPSIALQSDLSAVLREGRLLAGEVLQTFDGRTLLIGIGRHRVPAESQVELQQGHRFLFQVEGQGEGLVLRVLGDACGGEPTLLRALRSVLGHGEPLGTLLADLARALTSGAEPVGLLADMESHLARPEQGAAALATRLAKGGLAYEAHLALLAGLRLPTGEAAAIAAELEAWVSQGLAGDESTPGGGRTSPVQSWLLALRTELRGLLGAGESSASVEVAFARWLAAGRSGVAGPGGPARSPGNLEVLLATAERQLHGIPAHAHLPAELQTALQALHLSALGPGLEAILLRRLLGLPAAPPGELIAREERAARELLASDLKGRLLRASGELPEGPAREALTRALAGLEAEQLLNVARKEAHEALHWSLPLADGATWTTAHLLVHPRAETEGRAPGDEGDWRFVLALELTHTGPVRVDLVARPGSLHVGVQVASEAVAHRLSAGLAELEQRLAFGGRRVQIHVRTVPATELATDALSADVRYLREHHLMDVSA